MVEQNAATIEEEDVDGNGVGLADDAFAGMIPPEREHDPRAYVLAWGELYARGCRGDMKALDAQRMTGLLEKKCRAATGVEFDDASRLGQDPLLSLVPLFDRSEEELLDLEQAVSDVDTMRLSLQKKKRWLNLIHRLIIMQGICRRDAAKFWLYAGKDDDPMAAGKRTEYQPCHVEMFLIWNDPDVPNSLIEAPVGHGKSTCMRGQMAWEIGSWPELRHLYITEARELAEDTVGAVRAVVASSRFHALFPDIRILGRKDRTKDSARKFTVGRLNDFARDATMIGAGYLSSIQGSRYDRIWGDDICPPDVMNQTTMRDQINTNWDGVVRTRIADPRNSRIRLIGTPWHSEDVLGHTRSRVDSGLLQGWRVDIDQFRIYIDPVTDLPIPIWPEKWSAKILENWRRTSKTFQFTHELRFDKVTNSMITRVHFYNSRPGLMDDGDQKILDEIDAGEHWLSIDPAGTGNPWSSGQGVVHFVITDRGHLFIPDCWFYRCPLLELMERLVAILHDPTLARGTRFTGTHWEVQGGTAVYAPGGLQYFRNLLAENGIEGIQIRETGTRIGGTKQNLGKMGRLENASPFIQSGMVRLAGERAERQEPGGRVRRFLRAIPESTVGKLANLLLTWHGDPRTSDCIDATSQFILDNKNRIANPYLGEPVQPKEIRYTPMQLAHKKSMERLFETVMDEEPLDEEDRFLQGMYAVA